VQKHKREANRNLTHEEYLRPNKMTPASPVKITEVSEESEERNSRYKFLTMEELGHLVFVAKDLKLNY